MGNIKSSVSLIAFRANYDKCQLGSFTNQQTGQQFKSLIMTDAAGGRTFVAFSSKMGELSASQIHDLRNSLQVVTLDSGSHILCQQGANSWEDVDI